LAQDRIENTEGILAGYLRQPEPKREVMREDAVRAWEEPICDTCFMAFGTSTCQVGNFGRLQIVEEYHLDGSHSIHIVAMHYVYARLESMQVMATLDDAQWADPFKDAVKVLAHLGYLFQDGVLTDAAS
jgi:hypothetical protein